MGLAVPFQFHSSTSHARSTRRYAGEKSLPAELCRDAAAFRRKRSLRAPRDPRSERLHVLVRCFRMRCKRSFAIRRTSCLTHARRPCTVKQGRTPTVSALPALLADEDFSPLGSPVPFHHERLLHRDRPRPALGAEKVQPGLVAWGDDGRVSRQGNGVASDAKSSAGPA